MLQGNLNAFAIAASKADKMSDSGADAAYYDICSKMQNNKEKNNSNIKNCFIKFCYLLNLYKY